MPKFNCSYAYDVPCYADFVVEAADEAAAENLIQEALRAGRFQHVTGRLCWENGVDNERVFVSGPQREDRGDETMEQLIANAQ